MRKMYFQNQQKHLIMNTNDYCVGCNIFSVSAALQVGAHQGQIMCNPNLASLSHHSESRCAPAVASEHTQLCKETGTERSWNFNLYKYLVLVYSLIIFLLAKKMIEL